MAATKATGTRKKGPTTLAREYFAAISAHDLDKAVSLWKPGSTDSLVGLAELRAPEGIRAYFNGMIKTMPDFSLEVLTVTAQKERVAVQWRATGTFDGTGKFEGLKPNGNSVDIKGCDVLTVEDGVITDNQAYLNGAEMARQLGALPPQGSPAEKAMTGALNAVTTASAKVKRLRESR